MENDEPPAAKTRLLTQRECLSRAIMLTLSALAIVAASLLARRWYFLGVAAMSLSLAWPWWRYYLVLRRGNRTTRLRLLGLTLLEKTVTTTIEVAEVDAPPVRAAVSVVMVSLLTLLALAWAALSCLLLFSARSTPLYRLFAGTMDLLIGTFTVHCWRRVVQDVRSRRARSD